MFKLYLRILCTFFMAILCVFLAQCLVISINVIGCVSDFGLRELFECGNTPQNSNCISKGEGSRGGGEAKG